MNLTDNEKREILKYLEAGKPLPNKYRFLLFDDKREVELVWNGTGLGLSRPGEFHPQSLAEPDVNVSAHPAPIIQPFGIYPDFQCTNAS